MLIVINMQYLELLFNKNVNLYYKTVVPLKFLYKEKE